MAKNNQSSMRKLLSSTMTTMVLGWVWGHREEIWSFIQSKRSGGPKT